MRVLKKQGMGTLESRFLKTEPGSAQRCVSWTGVLGLVPEEQTSRSGKFGGAEWENRSVIIQVSLRRTFWRGTKGYLPLKKAHWVGRKYEQLRNWFPRRVTSPIGGHPSWAGTEAAMLMHPGLCGKYWMRFVFVRTLRLQVTETKISWRGKGWEWEFTGRTQKCLRKHMAGMWLSLWKRPRPEMESLRCLNNILPPFSVSASFWLTLSSCKTGLCGSSVYEVKKWLCPKFPPLTTYPSGEMDLDLGVCVL